MRKFFLILLALPAIGTLAHDTYIYTQNQDKGFMLSDLGMLWAKYHPESHDQWKDKIKHIGDTVSDLGILPEAQVETDNGIMTEPTQAKPYEESFTQSDTKESMSVITPVQQDDIITEQVNSAQSAFGWVLEQKAFYIFSTIFIIFFIVSGMLAKIFKPKSKYENEVLPHKRRGKNYNYNRK